MSPLLKSLETCAKNPIRNLVLLSKSERFCGLGAGLYGRLMFKSGCGGDISTFRGKASITHKSKPSLVHSP